MTKDECIKFYYDTNSITHNKTGSIDLLHTASTIDGMSGGFCVDPYDPSTLIGVNSHGKEHVIVEKHDNGTKTKHRYSIVNSATLIFQSSTYQTHYVWQNYFYTAMLKSYYWFGNAYSKVLNQYNQGRFHGL